MQTVSDAWIKNQQNNIITTEGLVDVTLTVTDPDAQGAASATDSGHISIADTAVTIQKMDYTPPRYATLETDLWALDGTYTILSDESPGVNGYIGNIFSGADGSFSPAPIITIALSQTFSSTLPGITITWGEAYESEYASDFTVTAWNGTSEVASKTITGNTDMTSVIAMDIQDYNKLAITVNKWCKPDRRARIQSILLGVAQRYDRYDLLSYQHSMSADPLSATLPKSEIVFEINNYDHLYDLDNPAGMNKYLMERQAVTIRYGYRLGGVIEWIKGGTFYLSEWSTPRNTLSATFTARDLLEFMNDKYTGTSSGSLYAIAISALTQANLPKTLTGDNRWLLDDALKSIMAPSEVDLSDYTIAEVLQLVANAGCCVLYQDREGVLQIKPLSLEDTQYCIASDWGFGYPETSLSKQLKQVSINGLIFSSVDNGTGETQEIKNPLISSERASEVAEWTQTVLTNRRLVNGEWRADPRVDCSGFPNGGVPLFHAQFTVKDSFDRDLPNL